MTLSKAQLRAIVSASDVSVKRIPTKAPRLSRVLATVNDKKRGIKDHAVRGPIHRTCGDFNPLNRYGVLVFKTA